MADEGTMVDTRIEDLVQTRWQREERPFFDGVLFDTGEIVIVECAVVLGAGSLSVTARPLARSTLASFLEHNPDAWVSITPLASVHLKSEGLVLTCGEGSFGGDGFVALCDRDGDHLRWIASFQRSNPFKSVALEGGEVVAISTHDHRWRFPLQRPDLLRIEA
jgi:hypothetical protein